ncbi:nickel-dependent lactate racemase [Myxococcota bacterium]
MEYRVRYRETHWEFKLPAGMRGRVAEPEPAEPLADLEEAVAQALAHPMGSPPLATLAKRGDRVCVVFTDVTRACPDRVLVPALLRELSRANVREEDVTLLCGTGMHRPSTHEEKAARLGSEVVNRYRVIDNEPSNPNALADLGSTSGGVPIWVHKAAAAADLLVTTGLVEPHQYAGYSGGPKTVAIGAGGEPTIRHTHGPTFLEQSGVRLGRTEGNPFREVLLEAAHRARLRFVLNTVLDGDKRALRVAAGAPERVHRHLVNCARSVCEVPIPSRCDVAIGGVPWPKDANLYQASRAASNLFFAPTPVVREGGYLIVVAQCPEGVGYGSGEQRFFAAMRDAPDAQAVVRAARARGYPPGQQRAFVMAKVLEQARVIIVGSDCPEVVAACKMTPVDTVDAALGLAAAELGSNLDVLVVPHALLTLPVVAG